ncbi:MAG: KamA family radical SAM protein [Proteobacteria bacterium]|nr:KamA family radical SAM protein [Pseudomonadota bacterium]
MRSVSLLKNASSEWRDWQWQVANTVRTVDDLPHALTSEIDFAGAARAICQFPMAVTPYYLSLIDTNDPGDPIRKMAIPSPRELDRFPFLADDPIAEEDHSPVPGLIRRYPDRAVILVSNLCAVYCRHCTRRHLGRGRISALDSDGLERALEYLREHPEIRDVILSGGDPLLEKDTRLAEILEQVRNIPSVEIIRVGTRVPVTLPMRVTEELACTLAKFHPLYVNTQFNHPVEVTEEAGVAIARLVNAGIPVANQAVLLRGVNDRPEIIEDLCRALLRIRVRPYYLFLCDLWNGIEHFRTTIQTGLDIVDHLRGRLSGIGIPQLIVDLPGGIGKIPLGPDYVVSEEENRTVLRSPDGRLAAYPTPADDSADPLEAGDDLLGSDGDE